MAKKTTEKQRGYRDAYKITLPDGRVVWNYAGTWGCTVAAQQAFEASTLWGRGKADNREDRMQLVYELVELMEEQGIRPTASKVIKDLGGLMVEGLVPEVKVCIVKLKKEDRLFVVGEEKYYAKSYDVLSTNRPVAEKKGPRKIKSGVDEELLAQVSETSRSLVEAEERVTAKAISNKINADVNAVKEALAELVSEGVLEIVETKKHFKGEYHIYQFVTIKRRSKE